jgi:hypothetical protein
VLEVKMKLRWFKKLLSCIKGGRIICDVLEVEKL